MNLISNEVPSKSHSIGEAPVEFCDDSREIISKSIEDFSNAALIFYMKLEFELLIPSTSVQYISQQVKELSDLSIDIRTVELEKNGRLGN